MIWNSVAIMTILDVLVVVLGICGSAILIKNRKLLVRMETLPAMTMLGAAFAVLVLMYLYDLATMYLFPPIIGMKRSMELMRSLHLNFAWIGVSFVSIFIFAGIYTLISKFIRIHNRLEQNQHDLEDLVEARTSQLRLALDHMPGAILVVDQNLDVVLVNDRYREFYGDRDGQVRTGVPVRDILKAEIEQGLLGGGGSSDEILEERLRSFTTSGAGSFEDSTLDGRTIQMVRRSAPGGFSVSVATDITEQLKIQRSTKLLSEALDSFPDMVILYDRNERVTFTNDKYHEIYPNAPAKSEITDYSMEQLLRRSLEAGQIDHPLAESDPEAWLAMSLETRRNPVTNTGETTHKNGRTYFFRHTRTTEGGMLLVQFDITERKKIEEELQESDNRFQQILEDSPIAVGISYDDKSEDDGAIHFANSRFAEMLGFNKNDLGRVRTEQFIPRKDDREADERRLDEGESLKNMEFELVDADGKTIWVLMSISPIFLHGRQSALIWLYDISDRKQAELKIAQNQQLLNDVIETAPVSLAVVRRTDGKIIKVNQATCDLLGLPEIELLKKSAADVYANPTDREVVMERMRKDGRVRDLEIPFRNFGSSDLMTCLFSIVPVEFDGEEANIASLVDITDRKRIEDELLIAKEGAEAAAQAKATFLATMSHEIRTPMNGVLSMANLIDQTRLTSEQKELTRTIRQSSEALVTIINDILDVSKIEAGMLAIENIAFSLIEQIDGIMDLMAPRAEAASLLLTLHIEKRIPAESIGDPTRVRQVLLNLLGNAVKFTEQGGVRLIVKTLDAATTDHIKRIRFEVVDSGIGMTPDQVDNLFQAFSQAESSTSRRFGGTGLGLAISKNLVELMGGEIGVQSEPGEGSTFWFEIPFGRTGDDELAPDFDLTPAHVILVDFPALEEESLKSLLALAGVKAVDCISNDHPAEGRDLPVPDLLLLSGRPGTPTLRARAEELAGVWPSTEVSGLIVAPQLALSAIKIESGLLPGIDLLGAVTTPPRASRLWEYLGVGLGLITRDVLDQISEAEVAYEPPSREEAIEHGCYVLVAEDNETNRFVIERVLTRLGIAHEIGHDGALALDMLRNTTYGLLLSDFHMPNMDGFELTKAIRADEVATDRPRLPIVALTADVLPETARLCEEAGMDGYLRKPIELDRLEEMIKAFVPKAYDLRRRVEQAEDGEIGQSDDLARTPLDSVRGVDPDIFDPSRLNDAFGTFDEDAAGFVLGFLDTLQSEIELINEEFEQENYKQVRDRVHAMKGASSSTGALRLGRLMGDMQDALDDDDPDTADIYRDGLAETLDELMSALEPLRSTL